MKIRRDQLCTVSERTSHTNMATIYFDSLNIVLGVSTATVGSLVLRTFILNHCRDIPKKRTFASKIMADYLWCFAACWRIIFIDILGTRTISGLCMCYMFMTSVAVSVNRLIAVFTILDRWWIITNPLKSTKKMDFIVDHERTIICFIWCLSLVIHVPLISFLNDNAVLCLTEFTSQRTIYSFIISTLLRVICSFVVFWYSIRCFIVARSFRRQTSNCSNVKRPVSMINALPVPEMLSLKIPQRTTKPKCTMKKNTKTTLIIVLINFIPWTLIYIIQCLQGFFGFRFHSFVLYSASILDSAVIFMFWLMYLSTTKTLFSRVRKCSISIIKP